MCMCCEVCVLSCHEFCVCVCVCVCVEGVGVVGVCVVGVVLCF